MTFDTVVTEARRKHDEQLLGLAVEWLERFGRSVPGELSSGVGLKDFHPSRELQGTFQFECLAEHLHGYEVLSDCDEWVHLATDYEVSWSEIKKRVEEDAEKVISGLVASSSELSELWPTSDKCLQIRCRWNEFVNSLRGVGDSGSFDALLRSACEPLAVKGDTLVLVFYHVFHKNKIEETKYTRMVEKKLAETFGTPKRIRCVPKGPWSISNVDIVHSILKDLACRHHNTSVQIGTDSSRLMYDDRQLAYAPSAVVEAINDARESLISKWKPSFERLKAMDERLSQTTKRLLRRAEVLKTRHVLPGRCEACRDL